MIFRNFNAALISKVLENAMLLSANHFNLITLNRSLQLSINISILPFATLLPLESGISGWKQAAIQIMQARTVIGSDPERASLLLSGDTIDGLHARLQVEQGTFWLMDCGSRCGTWINYNPIGNQPVELHPGDLIHIASAGFRFTIIDMASPPGATIEKYKLE